VLLPDTGGPRGSLDPPYELALGLLAAGRRRGRRLRPLARSEPGGTERSVRCSLTIRWLVTHESTESWCKGFVG
jgi:hypothetical protein